MRRRKYTEKKERKKIERNVSDKKERKKERKIERNVSDKKETNKQRKKKA